MDTFDVKITVTRESGGIEWHLTATDVAGSPVGEGIGSTLKSAAADLEADLRPAAKTPEGG